MGIFDDLADRYEGIKTNVAEKMKEASFTAPPTINTDNKEKFGTFRMSEDDDIKERVNFTPATFPPDAAAPFRPGPTNEPLYGEVQGDYNSLKSDYDKKMHTLFKLTNDQMFRSSGKGGFYNETQNSIRNLDRFGHRIQSSTSELCGLTFITRPRLNLTTAVIKQDPVLIMLDTTQRTRLEYEDSSKIKNNILGWDNNVLDPTAQGESQLGLANPESAAFVIRMLLDTKLARSDRYAPILKRSPFLDQYNPWLAPAMNNLVGISGFPDPTLNVFTTEGGFYEEQLSMVAGSDRCRKSFELMLDFNDIQNGLVMAMFQFWTDWMALLRVGITTPYLEDMYFRRLNYTVSIYRFMFDPTRQVITRYAKCTGCFPRAIPVGSLFNISPGEVYSNAAARFQVPFTCNVFEANKISIIHDFNTLARRYCPTINDPKGNFVTAHPSDPSYNYCGLPYIYDTPQGLRMLWRYEKDRDPNLEYGLVDGVSRSLEDTAQAIYELDQRKQQAFTDASYGRQMAQLKNDFPTMNADGSYGMDNIG